MSTCSCCSWWSNSPVISRGTSNFATYTRKCIASKKDIQSNTKQCKYFNPSYFQCDKYNCRLQFIQCLARRRNIKGLIEWDGCKRCRQFDLEVEPVVKNYFLDLVPIVTPRNLLEISNASGNSGRKIKRRDKGPRKIKRRGKEEKPKKIKRRKKKKPEVKERKIKRRSK